VPADVRARLAVELAAAAARPDIRAEFERRLIAVESSSAQELAATVSRELVAWAALIDEYKLAAD
jgi:tripartite-type tricarboxylate transporter receptor subunit TctC